MTVFIICSLSDVQFHTISAQYILLYTWNPNNSFYLLLHYNIGVTDAGNAWCEQFELRRCLRGAACSLYPSCITHYMEIVRMMHFIYLYYIYISHQVPPLAAAIRSNGSQSVLRAFPASSAAAADLTLLRLRAATVTPLCLTRLYAHEEDTHRISYYTCVLNVKFIYSPQLHRSSLYTYTNQPARRIDIIIITYIYRGMCILQ